VRLPARAGSSGRAPASIPTLTHGWRMAYSMSSSDMEKYTADVDGPVRQQEVEERVHHLLPARRRRLASRIPW
jgi:hypothetical protein